MLALYIAIPNTPGFPVESGSRDFSELKFKQGLDLQGGLHVVLQADMPPGKTVDAESMEAALAIIENRVNALGVSEPVIQREGDDRLIVELPGIDRPDDAIKLFRQTGHLSIVGSGNTPIPVGMPLALWQEDLEDVLSGADLKDASLAFDQVGNPIVAFELKPDAANRFADYTGSNLGKYLSIAVDGTVIQTASIQARISNQGQISGSFSAEEARAVAIQLRYGALPVPLKVIQNVTVGPTLGKESLDKSITAGFVGFGLVAIFMVLYYRVPGLVASIALVTYTLFVFAVFKIIPITITLSGIAGFILSVGMAVDANILIFERVKEEIRNGQSLARSVDLGFKRAWNSIRDSNISTLITCFVLWQFGTGIVKGFALTLAIGVLLSMFSAITVSRTIMLLIVHLSRGSSRDILGFQYKPKSEFTQSDV
tara:strand:- start:1280 stop:2560 length:1281 start_codon:yes stop_codon:yes gene_type:complete